MSEKGRLEPMFLNLKLGTPKNSFMEVVHYHSEHNFNTSNVKSLLSKDTYNKLQLKSTLTTWELI